MEVTVCQADVECDVDSRMASRIRGAVEDGLCDFVTSREILTVKNIVATASRECDS